MGNWIGSPASGCISKALIVDDVGVYEQRHDGTGEYTLDATESALACAMPACDEVPSPTPAPTPAPTSGPTAEPDHQGCLVAESSQQYVWVVHSDSTRNYIGSPASGCISKALIVDDVGVYEQRHDGTGEYTLDATE